MPLTVQGDKEGWRGSGDLSGKGSAGRRCAAKLSGRGAGSHIERVADDPITRGNESGRHGRPGNSAAS
jgi:hypothetical protein